MMNLLVLLIAVASMVLAQRKKTPKPDRKLYSLLGIVASIVVVFKAIGLGQSGTAVLFAAAAAVSLLGVVMDYLKPSNTDS
jgi:hypothetical protein